ncbi:MAG: hypothetical protein U9R17_09760 [Thermodesulfobacteriota bacterium]|nr:hypothetical protein [Thermodesulfobacteriota bacterium]
MNWFFVQTLIRKLSLKGSFPFQAGEFPSLDGSISLSFPSLDGRGLRGGCNQPKRACLNSAAINDN